MVPGKIRGVHGVNAHGVEPYAPDAELHGAFHGGGGEDGIGPEIFGRVPEPVPAGADEQEVRARGGLHGPGGYFSAGRAAARVQYPGLAAEGGGRQLIQPGRARKHVRRGVHVRADVGEELQPRLAEAVALKGAALGEARLLRTRPDEDVFGDGVGEVVYAHVLRLLSAVFAPT